MTVHDDDAVGLAQRLRDHASSHEWFVAALVEHYSRMAQQAGSDPLPERASQSDHAPVMREAADYIERIASRLSPTIAEGVLREALTDVLNTGINGGNNVRLAYLALGGKALTDELLAKAEQSEQAVNRARAALEGNTSG